MLDCRTILASAKAIWVVLGGLEHRWVVILDLGAIFASV